MDRLEYALEAIRNCDLCFGHGVIGWGNDEDYDIEFCDCNPNELIMEDGEIVWDNGMLFTTQEAL